MKRGKNAENGREEERRIVAADESRAQENNGRESENASENCLQAEDGACKNTAQSAVEDKGSASPDISSEGAENAEGKPRRAHRVNLVINIAAAVVLLGVFIFIFVYFYDEFQWLSTQEGREDFIEKLRGTGVWGVLILTLIQILQVVVAFIPGEMVELASGALYGVFGGLILCLVGLNIGTLIIFGLVRLLGGSYVRENVSQKQYKYLRILNDPDRALVALFFIFLIPGIPKDILIYFIPLTRVKMWKFMIVASIARIPSIISSTFTAEAALNGDYLSAGIIFGVFLVLGILGVVFNKQIYALVEKIFARKKKD